ncbi:MAG TPA: hypothetical protein VLV86_01190 [Vicinamibacterales bacterium]|nr:hypothetical protein [Vicinamibacterales bacterium]
MRLRRNSSDERLDWSSRWLAWIWRATAAVVMVAGGVLGYASVNEVRHMVPPKPPEVAHDVIARDVEDAHGKRASFRILLFSDEFRWRMSSHVELENKGSEPEFTPEMKAVLDNAQEIICIGESSEEGPNGLPATRARAEEERRAARRADQIALWIRRATSKPVPIHKLNIGQHVPTGEKHDTSDQRRMVIVLVLDRDDSVDLDQALRNAMAQESSHAPVFETLLKDYSRSATFTWEN